MNPFIPTSQALGQDFFNRDEIVESIVNKVCGEKAQGDVWISGERKMGKTSLLLHLWSKYTQNPKTIVTYQSDEERKVRFVYVNVIGCADEEEFYREMYDGLKSFDLKSPKKSKYAESFINDIIRIYTEKQTYVVFLIDEFDSYVGNAVQKNKDSVSIALNRFSSILQRKLIDNKYQKTFSCVFTANHSVSELKDKTEINALGSFLELSADSLEGFTEKQVSELAHNYLKDNFIKFSDDEIEICWKATKGYPLFVQQFFWTLYNHKQYYLNDKSLDKVIEKYTKELVAVIDSWSGENMPKRTKNKLVAWIKELKLGDGIAKMIFTLGEEFFKKFIA